MRKMILLVAALTIAATPAAAQDNAAAPAEIGGTDANMATNATDAATLNGLAADPALVEPTGQPVFEDPEATDATVTPRTREGGGGFPWGILGLLGLVGLIGRFRS